MYVRLYFKLNNSNPDFGEQIASVVQMCDICLVGSETVVLSLNNFTRVSYPEQSSSASCSSSNYKLGILSGLWCTELSQSLLKICFSFNVNDVSPRSIQKSKCIYITAIFLCEFIASTCNLTLIAKLGAVPSVPAAEGSPSLSWSWRVLGTLRRIPVLPAPPCCGSLVHASCPLQPSTLRASPCGAGSAGSSAPSRACCLHARLTWISVVSVWKNIGDSCEILGARCLDEVGCAVSAFRQSTSSTSRESSAFSPPPGSLLQPICSLCTETRNGPISLTSISTHRLNFRDIYIIYIIYIILGFWSLF